VIKWLLSTLLLLAPSVVLAQNQGQIVPSGHFTPGHTVRCQNSTCTVVVDGGGSAGSNKTGQGYLTEIGITNTGTPFCIDDALINSPGGYHQFCLGANALGGGLLSYNAYGGALPLGLNFNINGVTFAFPGPGNGNVSGPTSPAPTGGDVALWNGGTTLADGGALPSINVTGADKTGATDSTTAIQNCLNAVGTGGTCYVARGKYEVLGNLTIPAQTTLSCGFAFNATIESVTNYSSLSAIRLASSATISAGGEGASVKNCLIYRNGMTFPVLSPASYAGIAVSDAGFADFSVTDTIIVGFDTCIYNTGKRPYYVHDYLDCNGVSLAALELDVGNTDSGYAEDIKIQLLGAGIGSGTCAGIQRDGTGLRVSGPGPTGVYLKDIVVANFKIAQYDFEQGVLAGGTLWSDDVAYAATYHCGGTSIGYLIAPGAFIQANNLYSNASQVGMQINSNGALSRINYLAVNTGTGGGAEGTYCIQLGDGTRVGNLDVGTASLAACGTSAIHVATTSPQMHIQSAVIAATHGGVAPYIDAGPGIGVLLQNTSGLTGLADFLIGSMGTDLAAGANPYASLSGGSGFVASTGSEPMLRGLTVTVGGTCTGLGTGGSPGCAVAAHSDSIAGALTITTGNSGFATNGAAQFTVPVPPANIARCTTSNTPGTANWPNGSTSFLGAAGDTFTISWNATSPLAANTSYSLDYTCHLL